MAKKFCTIHPHFSGGILSYSNTRTSSQRLEWVTSSKPFLITSYLDTQGNLAPTLKSFPITLAKKMLKTMIRVSVCDGILYDCQRQGRIPFYLTNTGEEATQVGAAAALTHQDTVFLQYRELGVLLWRGFTTSQVIDQCMGNEGDEGKGRQMPVHYSAKGLGIHTISSPLGTQIPQAVGAGHAFRYTDNACSVVFFGEGAASTGDFAVALNFAATLQTKTIFVCRNNGFAISTPASEQYKGDGIASRAVAHGMRAIRVDGNDVVAVYKAVEEARSICIQKKVPVFLELMTYRVGHHSTSDDSSTYRRKSDFEDDINPIGRVKRYLINQRAYSEEEHQTFVKTTKQEVLSELKTAEKKRYVNIDEGLFNDVYSELPWNLQEQKEYLRAHLNKHIDDYPILSAYNKR